MYYYDKDFTVIYIHMKFITLTKLFTLIISTLIWVASFGYAQTREETDYIANYDVSAYWEGINDMFVEIDAKNKVGSLVSTTIFQTLSNYFDKLFPKLPQNNNYRIIYNTCKTQASTLAMDNTRMVEFDLYMDNCQTPLKRIMQEIVAKYTVRALASASPQNGSAPLTVTFDARSSTDPSNDTIPSDNFYRYYKNTVGKTVLIGRWSVVNHTFSVEGNYVVHMTAKSVNKNSQGIFDGSTSLRLNIAPEAANIVVYAAGKKLDDRVHTKFGSTEAKQWILFDASATLPKWWREILSYSWEIVGSQWFKYVSEVITGKPRTLNMKLPDDGWYTIRLSLRDNENNITTKWFLISVSDPIAIIKQTLNTITTSTQVTFDASASYSINSRIRRYNREVYDEQWEKIMISQQKSFSYKFNKPGNYVLNLIVTDELGNSNTETKIIDVESTAPQAQFMITPRLDWQFPSQFVLDATSSFDIDVTNGNDSIRYDRSFSNPSLTEIEQTYDNGQSVIVSFNEPGQHIITLTVTDSYGKISTLQRNIQIQSALRPVIGAYPRSAQRWTPIRLMVDSNKEILNYEWDFGDWKKEITQDRLTNYIYKTSGVYNIKLTATDKRWNKNSVSTMVFIGNKDHPIWAYKVLNSRNNILRADQTCDGNDAYYIKRKERFSIDVKESVNSKGQYSNLNFYFIPQDDEVYQSNSFSYSFWSLGCKKIDMRVEELDTSKTDEKTIRFYVVNDLPTLDSIGITFTQFGNEVGVGIDQQAKQDQFDITSLDKLIVKLTANRALDKDGTISQFLWYYYKAWDPTRLLWLKATPWHIPSTIFDIRTKDPLLGGWDIVFGVKMIDNDGGEMMSEEVIGQGPSVFIPPCTIDSLCNQDMDIPTVTLSVDRSSIAIWEPVTFKVDTKILSNRPDFTAQRVISFDFDGDGVWDKITKDTQVQYVYKKSAESIIPRVQVSYRKNSVVANGPELMIQQWLKIKLEPMIHDKTLYIRDYSMGDIVESEICFEHIISCVRYWSGQQRDIQYTYDTYGKKSVIYTIYDKFWNKAKDQLLVELPQPDLTKKPITELISIPRTLISEEWRYQISIGDDQENTVLVFVPYQWTGVCYVDIDTSYDSDFDGKSWNDADISCNKPTYIQLDDYTKEVNGRVVYEDQSWTMVANGIVFDFINQTIKMTPSQKEKYNILINLANAIPWTNDDQLYIKQMIKQMADNVRMNRNQTEDLITLRAYLETTRAWLSDGQIQNIHNTLQEFETSDTIAFQWWSIIDQVQQFLVDYAPSQLMKDQIMSSFNKIKALPEPSAEPNAVKQELLHILNIFSSNSVPLSEIWKVGNEEKIIQSDVETQILPRICEVLNFYNIPSEQCPDITGNLIITEVKETTVMWTILKWTAIVVLILWGVVGLIVVFFAVKARLQQNADEETSLE